MMRPLTVPSKDLANGSSDEEWHAMDQAQTPLQSDFQVEVDTCLLLGFSVLHVIWRKDRVMRLNVVTRVVLFLQTVVLEDLCLHEKRLSAERT
jgi:hypothetical protein